MAVPAGQRSDNKLEVLERAQKYAIHLIEITANTKNFPGRFAPIVTRMCDTAWEIAENIYTAKFLPSRLFLNRRGKHPAQPGSLHHH